MATRKYSTSHRAADGRFITIEHSSKRAALKAALRLPGSVRVATPAGNLVTYVVDGAVISSAARAVLGL